MRAALSLAVVAWFASGVLADPDLGANGSSVQLPYQVGDGNGNQWMIYNQGFLQQQGNQPIYSQGAMLNIGGQMLRMQNNNNQAKLDEKTKELLLDYRPTNGLTVQRRIAFEDDGQYVRMLDCFTNSTAREVSVQVTITTSLNYGVNDATVVEDPKKKDQNIAWAADTGANRTAFDVFAGKGTKLAPDIKWQQGNNAVQAVYNLVVPPKKTVSLIHWHGTHDSTESALKYLANLKEGKVLASLPPELRRSVVNLGTSSGFVGDYELLREDAIDVVELRGGDQVRGELQPKTYMLNTFYGEVALPAEKVVGLFNTGQFRPHQLLVTADGEIFGGQLKETAVPMKLSSGQVTQIPLSQITRLGYRKREGEPEEWKFEQPLVLLRSGERMNIKPPVDPVDFITRYGLVKLAPANIAAVLFESEESTVHAVYLTDGSRLSGLLTGSELSLDLATAAAGKPVTFPVATLKRLQFKPVSEENAAVTPTLTLASGDVLATRLAGELKFDTAFDTLTLDATQIRTISRVEDSATDVQIVLADQTTLRGQLQTQTLKVTLLSGVELTVPVPAIDQYVNPVPFAAPGMTEKVAESITLLGAQDWKERDAAEATLLALGPTVLTLLTEQRASQPPEVQTRIDAIIAKLKKDQPAGASNLPGVPGVE